MKSAGLCGLFFSACSNTDPMSISSVVLFLAIVSTMLTTSSSTCFLLVPFAWAASCTTMDSPFAVALWKVTCSTLAVFLFAFDPVRCTLRVSCTFYTLWRCVGVVAWTACAVLARPSTARRTDTVQDEDEDEDEDEEECSPVAALTCSGTHVVCHVCAGVCTQCNVECPITLQRTRSPVLMSDGFVYEKSAIQEWVIVANRSPLTNEPFSKYYKTVVSLHFACQGLVGRRQ